MSQGPKEAADETRIAPAAWSSPRSLGSLIPPLLGALHAASKGRVPECGAHQHLWPNAGVQGDRERVPMASVQALAA
jgi:hypothetical protein